MIISRRKLNIEISFYFFAVIALVIASDKSNLSLHFFIAMFIHEIGHLITILYYKIKIKKISFKIYGIKIEIDQNKYLTNYQEILILLSGALANFVAALIIYIFHINLKPLLISNLIIGTFNLLPVDSLDGGKITNIILFFYLPMSTAYCVSSIILIIFTTIFFTINFFAIIYGSFNLTLTILCVILILKITQINK